MESQKNLDPHRLVVCGSFGFGNAGDEAVPLAIQDLAKHLEIPLSLGVVGRWGTSEIPSVISMGEQDQQRRLSFSGSPVVMSGGGIIEPSKNGVVWQCKELAKKPFCHHASLFGCSVEPFVKYSFFTRWQLKGILRGMKKLYVRDLLSAETLQGLFPRLPVEVVGDPVLWMQADPMNLAPIKQKEIAVTLAPRWSEDEKWRSWISRELTDLAHLYQARIRFVPCSVRHDSDVDEHCAVARVIEELDSSVDVEVMQQELSPRQIAWIYRQSLFVVGMRLHACVMAYAQETPFVALAYHPKLLGFTRTVKMQSAVLPKSFPQEQSKEAYGFCFSSLRLEKGDLIDAVRKVTDDPDFSALPVLKEKLTRAFCEILDLSQSKARNRG